MEYQSKNYFYDNFRAEMLPYIPIGAKKIIEIGCGTGKFAALIKERQNCEIWGIEKDPIAAEICKKRIDKVLNLEIETAFTCIPRVYFDTICLLDVLEHLVDPWSILSKLREFLSKNGVIVTSIPNIRYFHVFADFVLKKNGNTKNLGLWIKPTLGFLPMRA